MTDPLFEGPHMPLAPMEFDDVRALSEEESSLRSALRRADPLLVQRFLAQGFTCVAENGQVQTKAEFLEQVLSRGAERTPVDPLLEPVRFGNILVTLSQGSVSSDEKIVVMHLWHQQDRGQIQLIHRHESRPGRARGELVPQWGGADRLGDIGHAPTLEFAAAVSAREAALAKAMTLNDREKLRSLLHPDLRYVHVTGHRSNIDEFPFERSTGFSRVEFIGTTMRQFGNAVVSLVNADFVHLRLPAQSRARAMHCWVEFQGDWRLVARQSTRFLPY